MFALRSIGRVVLAAAAFVPTVRMVEGGVSPVRPLNAVDRRVVERVRARAAARLEGAECRRVLADFADGDGRTLEDNLIRAGASPSSYLMQLAFVDGADLPICRSARVAMATAPGVPRVFVCPAGGSRLNSRLAAVEAESATLAEAMVVHEMLHALGLGENPPTSLEITERVRTRCR